MIYAAPAGFPAIITGKILGNTLLSLSSLLISLATAVAVYHTPVVLMCPGYFFVALIALVGSFMVISTVLAALLTLSRRTSLYMNCIEIPFILLCGFAFPVSVLPTWLRPISLALSPTWAVDLLRMAVNGVENAGLFIQKLLVLVLLSVGYALFSGWLYRYIDRQVRITASLEVC